MLFIATSMSRSGGRLRCHASLITTWLNSRSCEFCVYHSCPLVVSSLNQISCDFLLTCLKNSSRREVVQRWWRSQLLAGWLMSAVCSSRDRALGLSMLQETNVFSCSQMYNYLIMLNKNKMKHLFIYLFSPSPPKSGSRIWCPDPSGTRLLGGGGPKKKKTIQRRMKEHFQEMWLRCMFTKRLSQYLKSVRETFVLKVTLYFHLAVSGPTNKA